MINKNKKFFFKTLSLLVLIVIIIFSIYKINKSDLCISIIKYNYNFDYNQKKFSKKFKQNLLNLIDKENENLINYYRFNHNIIATSSKGKICQSNIEKMIFNLKNNDTSKYIGKIDFVKSIKIKEILFFAFGIFLMSLYLLYFSIINFVRDEIKFTKNKDENKSR